jgi:hypothetical protein
MKRLIWLVATIGFAEPVKWAFRESPFRVAVAVSERGPVAIPFDAPTVRLVFKGVEVPVQISEELEAEIAETTAVHDGAHSEGECLCGAVAVYYR